MMRENRRGEYVQKQVRHYATLTTKTATIRRVNATICLRQKLS